MPMGLVFGGVLFGSGVGNRASKVHVAVIGDVVGARRAAVERQGDGREAVGRSGLVNNNGLGVARRRRIAGQIGGRHLEIAVAARRQVGVKRPVAGADDGGANQGDRKGVV